MSDTPKIRVIAIDDDPMSIITLKHIIDSSDNMVLVNTYTSSIEGAAGIVIDKPDLLFLDINMPEFNGLEILKSLVKPPKIIVMSANSGYESEVKKLSAQVFIGKPLRKDVVYNHVNEIFSVDKE